MTFEECHQSLVTIRRQQGTRFPKVRIDCGGTSYRGRLVRADSDPEHRKAPVAPHGQIVLESLGTERGPEARVAIADIPKGGIRNLDEP